MTDSSFEMSQFDPENIPFMLYALESGEVYEHPYYRMVGFSGKSPVTPLLEDLIEVPEYSKLFFIPGCPPIGLDPATGEYKIVPQVELDGKTITCYGVASFMEPGLVRGLLPAVDYRQKDYTLPTWAYTAVGFKDEKYWAAGFRIEDDHRWDPRNFDDRELFPAIEKYQKKHGSGPLLEHLVQCATHNHCFAAKNLFLKRWEAPLPVSRGCNSACLACLSLSHDPSCPASHERIPFRPSQSELVRVAVNHLREAPEAIVSFGQGCEGEPLTEYELIAKSIKEIRGRTARGTINLNTNGSWPERIRLLGENGLDSIRISLNSARPDFYRAYYRPIGYDFEDVVDSIALSRDLGLYTMINYLVFPGVTDQEEEIGALRDLIGQTKVNFIHLKNLNIDPQFYLDSLPRGNSPAVGMKRMAAMVGEGFPHLELGYFNQAVR